MYIFRNIVVNDMKELREVRSCLTERCSVFGVTIVYRESKFSKPERGELRERERERQRERDVPYLVLPLSTERANSLNQREVS